jgi:hypothetical protein
MSLFFIGLVFGLTYLDKSLALSKVNRGGTFLVFLKLKKHSFSLSSDRHDCIRFEFLFGYSTPLFLLLVTCF